MLRHFLHVEISASCYQYHVTKQSVICLQDSIFVDSLGFPLFLDNTDCLQLHSWNAVMKLFTPSCLQSFSLDVLTRLFHFCPERLIGHGQRPVEPQCLLIERLTISDAVVAVEWVCPLVF